MIHELSPSQMRIAKLLLDAGAILFRHQSPGGKGFRLKYHEAQPNAPLSPIYLNLRTSENPNPGPLTPEHMAEIGYALYEFVWEERVWSPIIAGVPNAGNAFADAVASEARPRGSVFPRVLRFSKVTQGDRRSIGGLINGTLFPGQQVLGFDDLITKAHSKLEWVEQVRACGGVVRHIVVLVDREQGGREELTAHGVKLHSFLTLHQMLSYYGEMELVRRLDVAEVFAYLTVRHLAGNP